MLKKYNILGVYCTKILNKNYPTPMYPLGMVGIHSNSITEKTDYSTNLITSIKHCYIVQNSYELLKMPPQCSSPMTKRIRLYIKILILFIGCMNDYL